MLSVIMLNVVLLRVVAPVLTLPNGVLAVS